MSRRRLVGGHYWRWSALIVSSIPAWFVVAAPASQRVVPLGVWAVCVGCALRMCVVRAYVESGQLVVVNFFRSYRIALASLDKVDCAEWLVSGWSRFVTLRAVADSRRVKIASTATYSLRRARRILDDYALVLSALKSPLNVSPSELKSDYIRQPESSI